MTSAQQKRIEKLEKQVRDFQKVKSVTTTEQQTTQDETGAYETLINVPANTMPKQWIDHVLSISVSKNGIIRLHTNKRPSGACIVAKNVSELKILCAKAIDQAETNTKTFKPVPKKE
jgi:hypothetical protein